MAFQNTMVVSPYMSYIDNKPYYKKWGDQIVYLKEKLDLLEDDEVFVDGIYFEKRMNVAEQRQKSDGVSATGSSSSASHDRNESVANSVEDELMSLDSEVEESARKRKLKGKAIMIHTSKKKIVQRHSSAKKNLVLDRREKQKAEVEAKYEEIFGKRVNTKKPKKPKKKKAPQDFAMLRRSSRLSGNSGTSSGISPDNFDGYNMDVSNQKLKLVENPVEVSFNLKNITGTVDEVKSAKSSPAKENITNNMLITNSPAKDSAL